jgi:hypothetical protein
VTGTAISTGFRGEHEIDAKRNPAGSPPQAPSGRNPFIEGCCLASNGSQAANPLSGHPGTPASDRRPEPASDPPAPWRAVPSQDARRSQGTSAKPRRLSPSNWRTRPATQLRRWPRARRASLTRAGQTVDNGDPRGPVHHCRKHSGQGHSEPSSRRHPLASLVGGGDVAPPLWVP